MGLLSSFYDFRKYRKGHKLAQLLYPDHPNLWTDRIVKLPENRFAGGTGKLVHSEETYPDAVYTEFYASIEEARNLGYYTSNSI